MGLDDPPPPDLRDARGRARRVVIALLVGLGAGLAAYAIAAATVDPRDTSAPIVSRQIGAFGFTVWVGGISGVVAAGLALVVQNARAKRAWRAARGVARAEARDRARPG